MLAVDDAHLLDAASAALVRHLTESDDLLRRRHGEEQRADARRHRQPVEGRTRRAHRVALALRGRARRAGDRRCCSPHVDGATLHRLWEASRGNVLYLRELVLGGVAAGTLAQARGVWRWRGPYVATPRLTELVDARLGELATGGAGGARDRRAEPNRWRERSSTPSRTLPTARRVERRGLLDTVTSDRRRDVVLSHPLYAEAVRASTPPSSARVDLAPPRRPAAGDRGPSRRRSAAPGDVAARCRGSRRLASCS